MLGRGFGGGVRGGAHNGLDVLGNLGGHIVAADLGSGRSYRRGNGCGGDVGGLDPIQSLDAGAHLILNLANPQGGGPLGVLQPGVFGGDQRVIVGNGLRGGCSGCGGSAGVGIAQHPIALGFRLHDHLVTGSLGVGDGLLHSGLVLAVFLQLADQNPHLALEQSVFLVKGHIVLCQRLQKLIDLLHIVAAEGGFAEGDLIDLLRCKHNDFLPLR